MKPSAIKIYILIKSYDEITTENNWNFYVAEKRIVFKLSKISILNFESMIENLNVSIYYTFR